MPLTAKPTSHLHEARKLSSGVDIGIMGQFDVDSFDQQLRLRIVRHELMRRIPNAHIRAFAPYGSTRPITIAADEAVEPLAPLTPARRQELLTSFTLLVTCGHDRRGGDYTDYPVCDPADVNDALTFLQTPPSTISFVRDCNPETGHVHPAVSTKRVWTYALCEQRREFLRAMHWWPSRGAAVVVDASSRDSNATPGPEQLSKIIRQQLLGGNVVVIAGTSTARHLDRFDIEGTAHSLFVLPTSASGLEDRIAAYAGATDILSDDPAVIALASAFSRPCNGSRVDRSVMMEQLDQLDYWFDTIASSVVSKPEAAVERNEVTALRLQIEDRSAQLVHERIVFADYVRALRNQLDTSAAQVARRQHANTLRRVAQLLRRVTASRNRS